MKNKLINLLVGDRDAADSLEQDLSAQKKQVRIIQEVSVAIAGILQIDGVLDIVPKALIDTLGYKICGIQLIDEEKKNLRFYKINAPDAVLKAVKKFMGFSIYDLKIPLTTKKNYFLLSFL